MSVHWTLKFSLISAVTELCDLSWKLFQLTSTNNTHLMAIFQDTILDFIGARMMEWQLELWDTQSSSQIVNTNIHTNIQLYRPDSLPIVQSTVLEHWRQKVSHSVELFKLTWSLPSLSWPAKAPGYLGRVAKALVSPLMSLPHQPNNWN